MLTVAHTPEQVGFGAGAQVPGPHGYGDMCTLGSQGFLLGPAGAQVLVVSAEGTVGMDAVKGLPTTTRAVDHTCVAPVIS